MIINYYLMQLEEGWITIDDVPKKYREKVRKLLKKAEEENYKEA